MPRKKPKSKDKTKEKELYFIVEREVLGHFGSMYGSDKEEAQELLLGIDAGDLAVIKGVLIEPYSNL